MRFALASAGLLLLAVMPLATAASPVVDCVNVKIADTEACVYRNAAGDTCVALHRGEWVHVTRCAPLSAAAIGTPVCAESATDVGACTDGDCLWGHVGNRPFAACLVGTSSTAQLCTYDIVEAVAVCVGQGCATVFVGPSARQVCPGELIADPAPICTDHIIEAVSACYDDGCATAYTGPSSRRVCVPDAIVLA